MSQLSKHDSSIFSSHVVDKNFMNRGGVFDCIRTCLAKVLCRASGHRRSAEFICITSRDNGQTCAKECRGVKIERAIFTPGNENGDVAAENEWNYFCRMRCASKVVHSTVKYANCESLWTAQLVTL